MSEKIPKGACLLLGAGLFLTSAKTSTILFVMALLAWQIYLRFQDDVLLNKFDIAGQCLFEALMIYIFYAILLILYSLICPIGVDNIVEDAGIFWIITIAVEVLSGVIKIEADFAQTN